MIEKGISHHWQKRGGRELGGMGRGRRSKTRKLSLRILVKDADGFITSFRFLVKVWHPLERYATSSKVLTTMVFPATNFFSITIQTHRKNPDFPYDCYGSFESEQHIGLRNSHMAQQPRYRFNKLMSVFYASVLLLIINLVITLSKWPWNHEPQASGSAVNFDNFMTKIFQ